jgi:hypothetical protein
MGRPIRFTEPLLSTLPVVVAAPVLGGKAGIGLEVASGSLASFPWSVALVAGMEVTLEGEAGTGLEEASGISSSSPCNKAGAGLDWAINVGGGKGAPLPERVAGAERSGPVSAMLLPPLQVGTAVTRVAGVVVGKGADSTRSREAS